MTHKYKMYRYLLLKQVEHIFPGAAVVSIVSGLISRAIEVRSLQRQEDFFSNLCIQTGSGAHLASCPVGTVVLSPGDKSGPSVTLTTHPLLVPR
jgi:hypothetical protein